ncbi:UTP--glucose-1-phosphate uridylyltransferase [Moraxella bovis]|uniref:UTP--glucose-1-phosphate uridylyltransferase n=1 Tax=Moraxella bovis TaxID=476 RepID=A0AAQ2QAA2_MORBO|nr:UTP--glucose-1-phosphate uridylyltransferase [Moraxella bovis]UYZ73054.1 UTP--glucose-1-phosphate uridylyltransferase [Moraxella bovis]UYZ75896.1 UTP--glucose-1-phosphate uridylyltransferase [Moraxella bovis]UYZ78163.1 UTP--glucose-1-phosphate uridylyltransferase [Moraxella bovis]UYZ81049.1 UTP--glucose-1-phosphate uridylyltransferase [Moraxella bovis]UYZ86646.1 UTP--glucose-1-phosphate uridylyltransferase [Moraxella bovis]
MTRHITHAIIPTAGFGTRMLPLSKAVPKELLPLGDKPAIHYVVMEAVRAGIKNIVLVNHAQKSAIENYFDINSELDTQLRSKGKNELADSLNFLPDDVRIVSVRQGKPLGLGHAVLQGRSVVGDNPFAVLLPDVVLDPFKTDFKADNLAYMLDKFAKTGRSQILVDPVADDDVHKYGIARLADKQTIAKSDTNQSFDVKGFVEKPPLKDAPSNLAVVGRYVFSPEIFDFLAKVEPSVGGEIQLTDAIDALIDTKGVDVTTMVGDSFDAGDMTSYMRAFMYFAQKQLNA